MSQNSSFSVKIYSEVVAKILEDNRKRSRLSLNDVCSRAVNITKSDLLNFESGAISPRGYQLYELFQVYQRTITLDEQMFFCAHPSTHQKVLSTQFKKKYFTNDFSTRRKQDENTIH